MIGDAFQPFLPPCSQGLFLGTTLKYRSLLLRLAASSCNFLVIPFPFFLLSSPTLHQCYCEFSRRQVPLLLSEGSYKLNKRSTDLL